MNIAVVNLDSAMAQSAQGRELMEQLTTFQREIQGEISTSTNQLQQLRQRISESAHSLSVERLQQLQQQFEEGREKLRAYGIAPPVKASNSVRSLFGETIVACPRCRSEDTERVSEFGSTACRVATTGKSGKNRHKNCVERCLMFMSSLF